MQIKLVRTTYTLREAFGDDYPEEHTIQGYEPSGYEFVPEPDPIWQWDRSLVRILVLWWSAGKATDHLYLAGHTGAGKSSLLRNFCARLHIPFYVRSIHADLEFNDVVSQTDLIDGNTVLHYGPLPLAMGVSGYPGIFTADDVDRADPGFLSGFYEVLQGQPVLTHNGGAELVRPQPGFRIACTGNTSLMGDRDGLYVGAKQQDIAFGDRFWRIDASYLDAESERALLRRVVPALSDDIRRRMVDVAQELRAAFIDSRGETSIPYPMSTRALTRWAELTYLLRNAPNPLYSALDIAFLNAANGDAAVRLAFLKLIEGKLGTGKEDPDAA